MSLPIPWVQRIFEKLLLTYGRDFTSRWEGQDMAAVMADWADELSGFQQSANAIAHALATLPADKPPTVLQFRELCRKAPQYVPKALPAPRPDPEVAKAVRSAFKPVAGQGNREWAHKLQARIDAKEIRPTRYQREALQAMNHQEGPVNDLDAP